MYVRRTILLLVLGAGAVFVWQHGLPGRLLGGPAVVVNPHTQQDDLSGDQLGHDWLVAAAALGLVSLSIAALCDRLRLRKEPKEEFTYYVPMSGNYGEGHAASDREES